MAPSPSPVVILPVMMILLLVLLGKERAELAAGGEEDRGLLLRQTLEESLVLLPSAFLLGVHLRPGPLRQKDPFGPGVALVPLPGQISLPLQTVQRVRDGGRSHFQLPDQLRRPDPVVVPQHPEDAVAHVGQFLMLQGPAAHHTEKARNGADHILVLVHDMSSFYLDS